MCTLDALTQCKNWDGTTCFWEGRGRTLILLRHVGQPKVLFFKVSHICVWQRPHSFPEERNMGKHFQTHESAHWGHCLPWQFNDREQRLSCLCKGKGKSQAIAYHHIPQMAILHKRRWTKQEGRQQMTARQSWLSVWQCLIQRMWKYDMEIQRDETSYLL